MPPARRHPAPAALGARGRKLWTEVVKAYELRVDELILLEQAARTLDLVETLRTELVGAELVVRGSQGQPAAHPLLGELRQARSLLAQHFRQLGLPDLDEDGNSLPSARHAASAHQRWSAEPRAVR